jgi:hypothetical protein
MNEPLTHQERLTYAALLRTLVRLDGHISMEEQALVLEASRELLGPSMTPVGETTAADDDRELRALLDRSAEAHPDDESVRRAAASVTRPEAREAIFAALLTISTAGTITVPEAGLLDWLSETWDLGVDTLGGPQA